MCSRTRTHNKALLTTLLNDTRSKEAEDMAAVRAVETSSPASASRNGIRNAEAEGLATVRVVEPDSPAPAGHLQCTQVGAAEAAFDGQPEVTNLGSPGEAFLGLCSAPPAMTSPGPLPGDISPAPLVAQVLKMQDVQEGAPVFASPVVASVVSEMPAVQPDV